MQFISHPCEFLTLRFGPEHPGLACQSQYVILQAEISEAQTTENSSRLASKSDAQPCSRLHYLSVLHAAAPACYLIVPP